MLVAETCLLLAVRNHLRTALSLTDKQCDINLDNEVFQLAGDTYYSVTAAGTRPGKWQGSSGGIWDLVLDVRVSVFSKITEVARDKRRSAYIERLTGLNANLTAVLGALVFNYSDVIAAAHALLVGTDAEGGNYPEPFKSFAIDQAPRAVPADPYKAAQFPAGPMADPDIALARGITFRDARFMKER